MGLFDVARHEGDPRERYNELAEYYHRRRGSFEHPHVEDLLDELSIEPGESVLDVGCGLGYALELLAERVGSEGHVIGVDVSDRMVELAAERLADAGYADRASLYRADARELSAIGADSVDAIVMTFALEVFPSDHRPAILSECRRVLRPGGRLGVLAIGESDRLSVSIYERLNGVLPGLVDSRPIDARSILSTSGFEPVSTNRMTLYRLPVDLVVAIPAEDSGSDPPGDSSDESANAPVDGESTSHAGTSATKDQ